MKIVKITIAGMSISRNGVGTGAKIVRTRLAAVRAGWSRSMVAATPVTSSFSCSGSFPDGQSLEGAVHLLQEPVHIRGQHHLLQIAADRDHVRHVGAGTLVEPSRPDVRVESADQGVGLRWRILQR